MKVRILNHFKVVVQPKTGKQSIAAGFAIGTFISILPIPGFSVLIGTLLVMIFKHISKLAIFIAMAIWNPITLIPIYYLSYDVGMFLFPNESTTQFTINVLNRVYYFTEDFLVGNIVLAFAISCLSYGLIYYKVKYIKYRVKKKKSNAISS